MDFVGKVPTVFGFGVITSTIGSYQVRHQVRVYFINNSWRLSLASLACGSFGYSLDIDALLATNELFNMFLRVWMLEAKHWTAQRQLETPRKGVGLAELSPCSKLSKGPCMDLSLHVPNSYLWASFQLTSNLKINRSISHGSECCLCIGVEAYFYGWCSANPDFGIWSDEMAQLKSLCLVVSESVNSKAAYFISVNKCSCSHINFGQTAVEEKLILCCILVFPREQR